MRSLLLDRPRWDLCMDVYNNIAVCEDPYAMAQDAACGIKLFSGEDYYDVSRGLPYWSSVLGQWPPLELMRSLWIRRALEVPGVVTAHVYFLQINERVVTGQVQIMDEKGVKAGILAELMFSTTLDQYPRVQDYSRL